MGDGSGDASAGGFGRMGASGRNLWSGILFGIGLVAFLDEALFHQILHCITSTTWPPPTSVSSRMGSSTL